MEKWYFTFGVDSPLSDNYVVIAGDVDETRAKMFRMFGASWAGQYTEETFRVMNERYNMTEFEVE